MRARTIRLASAGALLLAASCSVGGTTSIVTGKVSAPVIAFPSQMLGLSVQQENVAPQLKKVERPYVDAVAIFSLREKQLLRATVQLSRFNRLARPGSDSFRRSIVGLLGGSKALEMNLGKQTVFSTRTTQQNVFVWFKDRGMWVLSVHQDYEFPRTLLRRLVDLDVSL